MEDFIKNIREMHENRKQNLLSSYNTQEEIVSKAINNDFISKGASANIGEIRNWNGRRYRKNASGHWDAMPIQIVVKKEASEEEGSDQGAKIKRAEKDLKNKSYDLKDKKVELKDINSEIKELRQDMESEAGEMGEDWSDSDGNRYGRELNKLEKKRDKIKKEIDGLEDEIGELEDFFHDLN